MNLRIKRFLILLDLPSNNLLFLFYQSVPESFGSESETHEAVDQLAEDEESDMGSDTFDDVDTGVLIEDDGSFPQFNDMEDELSDFESEGGSSSEFEGDVINK